MTIKRGSTRTVILTRRHAFKVPRFYKWKNFLWGLLANMQERQFSGVFKGLCPVLFSVPGGFLVVMERAEPLNWQQVLDMADSISEEAWEMAETKSTNFGRLRGELVVVDYGA